MFIEPPQAPQSNEESRERAKHAISQFRGRGGEFISMRLVGDFRWPAQFTQLKLEDREWLLWPNTRWDQPSIIIRSESAKPGDDAKLAMRFLSAIAWTQEVQIDHVGWWTGGSHINPSFRDQAIEESLYGTDRFYIDEHDYLPMPSDEKARIALALFRESRNLNDDCYRFLSLYKIVNLVFEKGAAQQAWINSHVAALKDRDAVEALTALQRQHPDIGKYLYTSGRCAVAHAFQKPLVNPDDPDDSRRLSEALPLMRELAAIMVEEEFGIKRRSTVWQAHLHELSGFKALLGPDVVDAITDNQSSGIDAQLIADVVSEKLPEICVRVRGLGARPFENLTPSVLGVQNGKVFVEATTDGHLTTVKFVLDFVNERLLFDLNSSFHVLDNREPSSAARAALRYRFLAGLLGNGQFEVWSASGILLGRQGPYIPTNIDPSASSDVLTRAAACLNVQTLRTMTASARRIPRIKKRSLLTGAFMPR